MDKKMIVEYSVSAEQIERLNKILPTWQNWTDANGTKCFANLTTEELFQTIMFIGSISTIDKHIDAEEWRQSIK